jgi:hypothetical protein
VGLGQFPHPHEDGWTPIIRRVALYLSLVYMSAATEVFDETALDGLLDDSRKRNTDAGLSGLLVFNSGRFMQLLEGPERPVLDTYARIVADPRHDEVVLLAEESIASRRFGEWAMAYRREDDGELPEGFSTFLDHGDSGFDTSRSRALLRWFRSHPMADPTAAGAKHRADD